MNQSPFRPQVRDNKLDLRKKIFNVDKKLVNRSAADQDKRIEQQKNGRQSVGWSMFECPNERVGEGRQTTVIKMRERQESGSEREKKRLGSELGCNCKLIHWPPNRYGGRAVRENGTLASHSTADHYQTYRKVAKSRQEKRTGPHTHKHFGIDIHKRIERNQVKAVRGRKRIGLKANWLKSSWDFSEESLSENSATLSSWSLNYYSINNFDQVHSKSFNRVHTLIENKVFGRKNIQHTQSGRK